jgi:hypothetical protein
VEVGYPRRVFEKTGVLVPKQRQGRRRGTAVA